MKAFVLISIMCCSVLSGLAQNRIHSWETDKITAITIELISADNEATVHVYKKKQDVDAIISFLKEVEFREIDGRTLKVKEPASKEYAKILFQGQRDQVYLFRKIAHIGKTTFLIDSSILDSFELKLEELKQ